MSANPLTDLQFSDLELVEPLRRAVDELGFTHCTPIQAEALPLALRGEDVAGQGQTGTGKTAAFLLATMQRLLTAEPKAERRANDPRALILAPTRELAVQIHRDAQTLVQHTGLMLGLAYGGVDYQKQRQQLADGVDILIGTPGRIIDYFKQRVFSLKGLDVAVLDEADRMFDLGFIRDIRYLFRRMPPPEQRLGMLFSATLSYRVIELAYEHMNNPREIAVDADHTPPEQVTQAVYYPGNHEKIPLLIGLLRRMDPTRTLIFANTKRACERLTRYLAGNDFTVAVLSGDVPQRKRMSLLRKFHEGQIAVLVATDVAARGLHIPEVSHVINFDLPQDAEDYVHRIGRTARLGAEGDAISFACEDYAFHLPDIEAYIGYKIPQHAIDPELLAEPAPPEKPSGPPPGKGGPAKKRGGHRRRRSRGGKPRRDASVS